MEFCIGGHWEKIDNLNTYKLKDGHEFYKGTLESDSSGYGIFLPGDNWIWTGSWKMNELTQIHSKDSIEGTNNSLRLIEKKGKCFEVKNNIQISLSGQVSVTYFNGSKYVGTYKNGSANGPWKSISCECLDGNYIGKKKNDLCVGKGILEYPKYGVRIYENFSKSRYCKIQFKLSQEEIELFGFSKDSILFDAYAFDSFWVFKNPEDDVLQEILRNTISKIKSQNPSNGLMNRHLLQKLILSQAIIDSDNDSVILFSKIDAQLLKTFTNEIYKLGGIPYFINSKKIAINNLSNETIQIIQSPQ